MNFLLLLHAYNVCCFRDSMHDDLQATAFVSRRDILKNALLYEFLFSMAI